jgi:hypothetical protein
MDVRIACRYTRRYTHTEETVHYSVHHYIESTNTVDIEPDRSPHSYICSYCGTNVTVRLYPAARNLGEYLTYQKALLIGTFFAFLIGIGSVVAIVVFGLLCLLILSIIGLGLFVTFAAMTVDGRHKPKLEISDSKHTPADLGKFISSRYSQRGLLKNKQ